MLWTIRTILCYQYRLRFRSDAERLQIITVNKEVLGGQVRLGIYLVDCTDIPIIPFDNILALRDSVICLARSEFYLCLVSVDLEMLSVARFRAK